MTSSPRMAGPLWEAASADAGMHESMYVRIYVHTHTHTHSLRHSPTHSLTHSPTHSLTHSLTHAVKRHEPNDAINELDALSNALMPNGIGSKTGQIG